MSKSNAVGRVATLPYKPVSSYFGESKFGLERMRETLPADAYGDLTRCLEIGKKISQQTAEAIAQVIKEWAVQMGVTHYCHWFQPMSGQTAEKQHAFISVQYSKHSELKVMERFTGQQLVQGEPDASSFPSGGMRSTFEARGYTAWDPAAALFIVEGPRGTKTLCIPSVFFGYHGQALDNKTPLLRSNETLSQSGVQLLKLLGDVDVKRIEATLGAEQEYFLIDRKLAAKRPDIIMTGRTLIGAPSVRGQKLEDHYFGSIPRRVKAFMEELEQELYGLGVPVKTRHNEVAPAQFEMAPIFEQISIASDHNTLTMETMKRVAARNDLLCLFHEKPFAELNGSGKHCNWSLRNDKGENLLDPGRTPHQNLRFLTIAALVVSGVYRHADVLAAAITSPGNDHRLGANEAPPAIISVFLGDLLDKIYESVLKGEVIKAGDEAIINLGVGMIPDISRDYTDRNRTSPFAFTGNKFEFRAVGGSANVAVPMAILNAAVAESFDIAAVRLQELQKGNKKRDEAVLALIKDTIKEAKDILFSGNNYSEDWQKEAVQRKLPVVSDTVSGIEILSDQEKTKFLVDTGVFSESEIASRSNVKTEHYIKTALIEFETLVEMVTEFVIPALEKQLIQTSKVFASTKAKKLIDCLTARQSKLETILTDVLSFKSDLTDAIERIRVEGESKAALELIKEEAQPLAEKLRAASDKAEVEVADEFWQFPKYRDLLFHVTLTA